MNNITKPSKIARETFFLTAAHKLVNWVNWGKLGSDQILCKNHVKKSHLYRFGKS